jgi:hypothetical protein
MEQGFTRFLMDNQGGPFALRLAIRLSDYSTDCQLWTGQTRLLVLARDELLNRLSMTRRSNHHSYPDVLVWRSYRFKGFLRIWSCQLNPCDDAFLKSRA